MHVDVVLPGNSEAVWREKDALEASLRSGILAVGNQAESVGANLEKRKPNFLD